MCSLVPIVSTFPSLEYLDLSCARITSKAALRFGTYFPDFPRLSHLELNGCCLSDEDANIIICNSIQCKTLVELSLRDNQIVLMPILSLCAHLCNSIQSRRTLLTMIDFSSNPLDIIAYERIMDMTEEKLLNKESDSIRISYNDCNWSHSIFGALGQDANSLAYCYRRNFDMNGKIFNVNCDCSKHVWQCFLMVLQWRQCHSTLPTCNSDFKFASKSDLFEGFVIPKDASIVISCHELGFWDLIGHKIAILETSDKIRQWIEGMLKLISFHDFGVPEAVIIPVVKHLIIKHKMFFEAKYWKQLLAFSGSYDGRLGILLTALAKQISSPDFKEVMSSLPESIAEDACQKFSIVLLHSDNYFSGRWHICFEKHLHRLSFERLHSFTRTVRIQRINDLSLDLSDDCSVNIVRDVQDEFGQPIDFEKFFDSNGCVQSTKSFLRYVM
jgi:hypothetical protein